MKVRRNPPLRASVLWLLALAGAAHAVTSAPPGRLLILTWLPHIREENYGVGAISPDGSRLAIPKFWRVSAGPRQEEGPARLDPRTPTTAADKWSRVRLELIDPNAPERIIASRVLPILKLPDWNFPASPTAVYSSDGKTIAVAEPDGRVDILSADLKSLTSIETASAHAGPGLLSIALSRNGSVVVALAETASEAGFVTAFAARTGTMLWNQRLPHGIAVHVAFSPDGKRLAWTLAKPGELAGVQRQEPLSGPNLFVASAKTGATVASATTGDFADWVGFGADDRIYTAPIPQTHDGVFSVAHGTISVWDARTGALLTTIQVPGRSVHSSIGLSPNGEVIYGDISRPWHQTRFDSIARHQEIAAWDPNTGKLLASLGGLDHGRDAFLWPEISAANGTMLLSDGSITPMSPPVVLRLETGFEAKH
jgi:WD40 repeat protein